MTEQAIYNFGMPNTMILTFTPNPCVDKTVFIDRLKVGERIRSERCTCIPGGKGTNVSRAVKIFGHETAAMNIVGGHTGRHVVEMIEEQDGIRTVPCWVADQTRTITTVLEECTGTQTAFFEPGPQVTEAEHKSILNTFRDSLEDVSVVVLSGTVPCPSLEELYGELIPIAHAAGCKVILDSHSAEFAAGLTAKPDMIKPNHDEAAKHLGYPVDTLEAQHRAIADFHNTGIPLVVLSLGKDGCLVSDGNDILRATPPIIDEVNPVGSGDALVAPFAIGLQEGWDLERMARYGCAAGTANAMSWDIAHFTMDEVEEVARRMEITNG